MYDNVKIPLSLLNQTLYILENIEIHNYDNTFTIEYYDLIGDLRAKKDSLDLREAYAKIIRAKDDDTRFNARMRYLQLKRDLNGGD